MKIRTKIRLCTIACVIFSLVIMTAITIVMNYRSTLNTLEQTMAQTAKIAAERVEMELETYRQITSEVGCLAELSSPDVSTADKEALLLQRADIHGFQGVNLIGTDGISLFNSENYSDYTYFQAALSGETYISIPMTDPATGVFSTIVAAPLWKNGTYGSSVVGVVCFAPPETFLNDIVAALKVSDNGSAYMLDKDGYTIAHKDMENVKSKENTAEDAKTDTELAGLAAMETKMTEGESGFGKYSYGGVSKFLAYAPINGTDGWSIGVNAPQADIMGTTKRSILITFINLITDVLLAIFISGWLAKRISRPVEACVQRMHALAAGDLNSPVPESHSKDETGDLLRAVRELTSRLDMLIEDTTHMLERIADGDFTARSRCEEHYVGDFSGLLRSADRLERRLSETMLEVDQAANQVSMGSGQVSSGAQTLSQGSTEQASSIQELAATISEISNQIEETAGHAENAKAENLQASSQVQTCDGHMNDLVNAMRSIEEQFDEINKIVKTIEDIAFQTNILALNAAVEAARAGSAGKGFAVVADEVRNLASRSSEAAKNTTLLIGETVKAVNEGTRLSGETDHALQAVIESVQRTLDAVSLISKATGEESKAVAQISQGIDQISNVVQTNSATAEESAAASEELSGQASLLKTQVERFKLLDK